MHTKISYYGKLNFTSVSFVFDKICLEMYIFSKKRAAKIFFVLRFF